LLRVQLEKASVPAGFGRQSDKRNVNTAYAFNAIFFKNKQQVAEQISYDYPWVTC
jgi:hypothetical protein